MSPTTLIAAHAAAIAVTRQLPEDASLADEFAVFEALNEAQDALLAYDGDGTSAYISRSPDLIATINDRA